MAAGGSGLAIATHLLVSGRVCQGRETALSDKSGPLLEFVAPVGGVLDGGVGVGVCDDRASRSVTGGIGDEPGVGAQWDGPYALRFRALRMEKIESMNKACCWPDMAGNGRRRSRAGEVMGGGLGTACGRPAKRGTRARGRRGWWAAAVGGDGDSV